MILISWLSRKRKAAKQEKRPVAMVIIRGKNLSQGIKARGQLHYYRTVVNIVSVKPVE